MASLPPPIEAAPTPRTTTFEATAYSVKGTMKSGQKTRPGVVAADPRVLPIGTRIRVGGAGAYSGDYTVLDTGREIKGREIDIFMPAENDAAAFGRQQVSVEVLSENTEK
ncbi:MAG: 3D domain-containing protein [bacterium]